MYTAIFIGVATFTSYWVGWFMGRWRAGMEFKELRGQLIKMVSAIDGGEDNGQAD